MRWSASLAVLLIVVSPRLTTAAATWTQIDVASRLDADGRFQVVETHQMRLDEGGGFELAREVGRSVDQEIVVHGVTRVGPDGEHPLPAGKEDVDRYRYDVNLGSIYLGVPPLPRGATLAYRFEYEIVHALSPAWGFAARPEPLFADPWLPSPAPRVRQVWADLAEARPFAEKRYRLDHDVISPRRNMPFNEVQSIRYRLDLAPEWTRVDSDAEPGRPAPDKDYRVRRVLRFLGPEPPSRAATAEAATRWLALAAMPVGGLILAFGLVAVESLRARRWGVDRAFVERHLLPVAPEVARLLLDADADPPTPHEVLTRLAAERRLAVEFTAEETNGVPDVRLRRLVPRESLRPFERDVVDGLFDGADECTSAGLRAKHRREGFDLSGWVREAAVRAMPRRLAATWTLADVPASALFLAGVALQIRGQESMLPLIVMPNVLAFVVAVAFSTAWWHPGRSLRATLALLLPVAILGTGAFLYEIAWDRPLLPTAWIGAALSVLGAHLLALRRATVPARGGWEIVRDLNRIRGYAAAQLRRPRPDLADAWIPHLVAMGLGPRLERWRARFGDAAFEPGTATAGPRFTGRGPSAFTAGPRWTDALVVDSPD